MKRFALLFSALFALSTPAFASASGRAIEAQLYGVSPSGSGGCDWVFLVDFLNMAGSCGALTQQGIIVHTSSCVALPSNVARADAYVDFGNDHTNGLTCAGNTMQLLTPVTLITFLDI